MKPFHYRYNFICVVGTPRHGGSYVTKQLFRALESMIPVTKKATKAAYQGGFFDRVLGPNAEYIITLRHPIPACISTYEKSGGLPADGRLAVRGNIET